MSRTDVTEGITCKKEEGDTDGKEYQKKMW